MDKFLVFSATGAQGGAVARRLVRDGHTVRGVSRTGAPMTGVEMVAADLADPSALHKAFEGVTHAAVVLPMIFDPSTVDAYVGNIIEAARAGNVRRLVFNTACPVPDEPTEVLAFESRRRATRAFLDSGIPVTVVRPPSYVENLTAPWSLDAILREGVIRYPLPAGVRVSWLSHNDLAATTVAALTSDDLIGEVIDIGGPQTVDGDELSTLFSQVLGRPITYEPLPVDAFVGGLGMAIGQANAANVGEIYRYLETVPDLYEVNEAGVVPLTPLPEAIAGTLAGAEVVRMHQVIEDWLSGGDANLDAFADSLAPDFTWGSPDGAVAGRAETIIRFKDLYGCAPGVSVDIRDVSVVAAHGGLLAVNYQEWQRTGSAENGRRSTAILSGGLKWRHLQETWIRPPA